MLKILETLLNVGDDEYTIKRIRDVADCVKSITSLEDEKLRTEMSELCLSEHLGGFLSLLSSAKSSIKMAVKNYIVPSIAKLATITSMDFLEESLNKYRSATTKPRKRVGIKSKAMLSKVKSEKVQKYPLLAVIKLYSTNSIGQKKVSSGRAHNGRRRA